MLNSVEILFESISILILISSCVVFTILGHAAKGFVSLIVSSRSMISISSRSACLIWRRYLTFFFILFLLVRSSFFLQLPQPLLLFLISHSMLERYPLVDLNYQFLMHSESPPHRLDPLRCSFELVEHLYDKGSEALLEDLSINEHYQLLLCYFQLLRMKSPKPPSHSSLDADDLLKYSTIEELL